MAAAPGARLEARDRRGRAHPRARERARLLLRPQRRRDDPPEGVRGPDLRPHGPQGRSHRHRDHQPPRRAGLGPRHPAAGRASRDRARAHARRRPGRGRAAHRHADRRIRAGARPRGRARDRRRPDDVQVPHALRRQGLRRPRDGAARGAPAARHGDGAVPSDRSPRRTAHAHDRHGDRGGPARRGRLSPRRRGRAVHEPLRRARRAGDARHRVASDVHRDAQGQHHAARRSLHRDGSSRPRERAAPVQGHGRALRRLRLRSRRRAASKWCRPRTT